MSNESNRLWGMDSLTLDPVLPKYQGEGEVEGKYPPQDRNTRKERDHAKGIECAMRFLSKVSVAS